MEPQTEAKLWPFLYTKMFRTIKFMRRTLKSFFPFLLLVARLCYVYIVNINYDHQIEILLVEHLSFIHISQQPELKREKTIILMKIWIIYWIILKFLAFVSFLLNFIFLFCGIWWTNIWLFRFQKPTPLQKRP